MNSAVDLILSGKSIREAISLTEKTSEAEFLFRDFGMTTEEVLFTIGSAVDVCREAGKTDLADELSNVEKLLQKMWGV